MPEKAYTIKVGAKTTSAKYYIEGVEKVRELLSCFEQARLRMIESILTNFNCLIPHNCYIWLTVTIDLLQEEFEKSSLAIRLSKAKL